MKTTRHPFDFKVHEAFPNARRGPGWEGGGAYLAERDGVPYVIVDERTMADFLGDDDRDMLDELVQVFEFDSEEERAAFVRDRFPAPKGER